MIEKPHLIFASSPNGLRKQFAMWFVENAESAQIHGYQFERRIGQGGIPIYAVLVKYTRLKPTEKVKPQNRVFFHLFCDMDEKGCSAKYDKWIAENPENITDSRVSFGLELSPASSHVYGAAYDCDLFVVYQVTWAVASTKGAREYFADWLEPKD